MHDTIPSSPIAVVGTVALLAAFVLAALATAAGIVGHARNNPRLVRTSVHGLYAFFAMVAIVPQPCAHNAGFVGVRAN